MGPIAILGSLALTALLFGGKAKPKTKVRLQIELEGDYKTPNGESTELDDMTIAEAREDILAAFPVGSWLSIDDDLATVETKGDYYVNQLIPTPNGQIVIYSVTHIDDEE